MSSQQTDSFPTLTQWSHEHIQQVFESSTNDDSMRALEETFDSNLKGSANGKDLGYEQVRKLALAVRGESLGGNLKVEWHNAVEVPTDASHRNGVFGGSYTIHGIYKMLPNHERPVRFARHKVVTVRIESLDTDPSVDSRRIVELVFVATDEQVDSK